MRGTAKWRIQPLHMDSLGSEFTQKPPRSGPRMTTYRQLSGSKHREKLVEAYSHRIGELMDEGRLAYYLNFMFNHLPGSRETKIRIMVQEVERVHWILMHHIVRRPNAVRFAHLR